VRTRKLCRINYADIERTIVDLKRNMETEREVWSEERTQLVRQAQEAQKESSGRDLIIIDLPF